MIHKFSYWPSVTGPLEVKERTWDQIMATFALPRVTLAESLIGASKNEMQDAKRKDIPGWSPSIFNGSRSLANFVEACAIGVDFDGDSPCIDDLVIAFGLAAGFIHSTVSHTPEAPRSRVVLPLSRPVNEPEYRALWSWASSLAPGADRKACDPSRLWFVPAVIKGCEYRFEVLSGEPIPVDYMLSAFASLPRIQASRSPVEVGAGGQGRGGIVDPDPRPPQALAIYERAALWLSKRAPSIEGSDGRAHCFVTAQFLVRGFELSRAQAFSLLSDWNRRNMPPFDEWELRNQIKSADEIGKMERGKMFKEAA